MDAKQLQSLKDIRDAARELLQDLQFEAGAELIKLDMDKLKDALETEAALGSCWICGQVFKADDIREDIHFDCWDHEAHEQDVINWFLKG